MADLEDPVAISAVAYVPKEWQAMTLTVVSCFSASLSILGSGTILYLARPRVCREPYHRLVSVLSAFDIMFSSSVILQPFLLPVEDASHAVWALGNHSTCTTIGFFFMYGMSAIGFYNAVLSVYFLLLIRYNFHDQSLVWTFEIPAHVLGLAMALTVPLAAVVLDSYGVAQGVVTACVYTAYPRGCLADESVECIRGEESVELDYIHLAFTAIEVLVGIACTILLYWRVRHQLRRNLRYMRRLPDGSSAVGGSAKLKESIHSDEMTAPSGTPSLYERHDQTYQSIKAKVNHRLRDVRMQGGLYSAIYFNLFVWTLVATIVSPLKPNHFPLQVIIYLLFPLQGALNAIVYIRPSYNRWRAAFPDYSFGQILFRNILTQNTIENEKRNARIREHYAQRNEVDQGPLESNISIMMESTHREETPEVVTF